MKLAPLLEQQDQKQLQRIVDILNKHYAGKTLNYSYTIKLFKVSKAYEKLNIVLLLKVAEPQNRLGLETMWRFKKNIDLMFNLNIRLSIEY